jgi:hypothetical protein
MYAVHIYTMLPHIFFSGLLRRSRIYTGVIRIYPIRLRYVYLGYLYYHLQLVSESLHCCISRLNMEVLVSMLLIPIVSRLVQAVICNSVQFPCDLLDMLFTC